MGDFFVRRPIVAMVLAIFMVIVGVVFLSGLPMEQYPNITPPIVGVPNLEKWRSGPSIRIDSPILK